MDRLLRALFRPRRGLLLFLLTCGLVPTAGAETSEWLPRTWEDFPVVLELTDRGELDRVAARLGAEQVSRESLRRTAEGWRLRVRVDEGQWRELVEAGWTGERVVDVERRGREAVEESWRQRDARAKDVGPSFPLSTYPTHTEIGTILDDLVSARPDIARSAPIGTSFGGRTLWGIVISDHPDSAEVEPEVRLAAGIHGDETVASMMLLNLAEALVTRHGQPGHEFETTLVDETEIHIVPLFNPDGYAAGTRTNARGVDLNRNFPEPVGTHFVQEVETTQFMDHALDHHFVVSLMGHGGALVVNYPWDYTYTRAPDDDALIDLSLEYSTRNLPMYEGSFSQGITNGADWYVVSGSLQDWVYDQTGCLDVTLEISNIKWPAASTLPDYWSDNEQSLLHYVEAARYGLRGVVTDARSGAPLDAVITVAGNAEPVTTDPARGDWYKLVSTGSYDLTVEAVGYEPETVEAVATTWGTPTVVDVALDPVGVSAPDARAGVHITSVTPNPFNPATTVSFRLESPGHVRLEVLDARGRHRRNLLDAELGDGEHRVQFDGRDDRGRELASGVYFLRLRAAGGTRTAKAVLVR